MFVSWLGGRALTEGAPPASTAARMLLGNQGERIPATGSAALAA